MTSGTKGTSLAAAIAIPFVLLLSGCGGSGLRTIDFSGLPVQTVTPEELVAGINRDAGSLNGIRGKLGMGLRKTTDGEEKRCSGMLVAVNTPRNGLYLKGYKRLIPTFFTLVCDGEQFWFHIPRDDVVYIGPADFVWSRDDSLELYLNARDLFRALFVGGIEPGARWDVKDDGAHYLITVYNDDRVARTIQVERRGFNVIRETYYNEGTAQIEINRDKFASLDGRVYPSSLVLNDLVSGSSVYLDFTAITLDPEDVPDGAFRFRIPDDVDIIEVDSKEVHA
jgi:hypothetical protein